MFTHSENSNGLFILKMKRGIKYLHSYMHAFYKFFTKMQLILVAQQIGKMHATDLHKCVFICPLYFSVDLVQEWPTTGQQFEAPVFIQ